MKTLIYRDSTTTFQSLFDKIAEDFSSKLKFTTKEEYLAWVKNWKFEMNILDRANRVMVYSFKRDACKKQSKIDNYQKKYDSVKVLTPEEEVVWGGVKFRCTQEADINIWQAHLTVLIWYMLALRKAGKIRARKQWEAQQQNIAVV